MENTKISLSWILLATIPSCLAFTSEQIRQNNELYVVKDTTKNELTCFSEDDDAALVWNDDLSTRKPSNDFNNFEPVKPIENILSNSECAIWKSRQCFVEWSKSHDWKEVSAVTNPMAPVYDFRWEGFREYVVNDVESKNVSSLVAEGGAIIFSIRGTNDIRIHLCEDLKVGWSSCPVIKLANDGVYSSVKYCESWGTKCRARSATHETAFLDADVWQTFRLQWIKNERKIEVFHDTYKYASVQSNLEKLHNIFISSSAVARIRFHDYKYILATYQNSIITTKEFDWPDDFSCVNMVFSLCSECHLTISLIDSSTNKTLAEGEIHGDEQSHSSRLREWHYVKLTLPTKISSQRRVQLKFKASIDNVYLGDVWWAIDDLHLCEQNDGVRRSTIKLPSADQTGVGTNIKCQKLLRDKTAVAELPTRPPMYDTTRLREYVKNLTKSYSPGCRVGSTTNCDDTDSTNDRRHEARNKREDGHNGTLAAKNINEIDEKSSPKHIATTPIASTDTESPPKQIEARTVILSLILMICLLLLILFLRYRKYKKTKMQAIDSQGVSSDLRSSVLVNSRVLSSDAQYLPSNPVHSTSSKNFEEQTSSAQNVPFEPPYMIPRDLSEQATHQQNVALAPVYMNISNDSREESSHAQNVPSDPEYWEISDNSREQPTRPQDLALAPLYTNTLDNSKKESNYLRDASLDPEYLIILNDSREETSYVQDIPLAPVYMNISNNSRKQTRYALRENSIPDHSGRSEGSSDHRVTSLIYATVVEESDSS